MNSIYRMEEIFKVGMSKKQNNDDKNPDQNMQKTGKTRPRKIPQPTASLEKARKEWLAKCMSLEDVCDHPQPEHHYHPYSKVSKLNTTVTSTTATKPTENTTLKRTRPLSCWM